MSARYVCSPCACAHVLLQPVGAPGNTVTLSLSCATLHSGSSLFRFLRCGTGGTHGQLQLQSPYWWYNSLLQRNKRDCTIPLKMKWVVAILCSHYSTSKHPPPHTPPSPSNVDTPRSWLLADPSSSSSSSQGLIVNLDHTNFDSVVHAEGVRPLHLIEFYAHWCGHCQKYAKTYRRVAHDLLGASCTFPFPPHHHHIPSAAQVVRVRGGGGGGGLAIGIKLQQLSDAPPPTIPIHARAHRIPLYAVTQPPHHHHATLHPLHIFTR
jgi:thiol-disulfide isomerase/thioredoxin